MEGKVGSFLILLISGCRYGFPVSRVYKSMEIIFRPYIVSMKDS